MPGMTFAERHARDQIMFYMKESVSNLSNESATYITKSKELKSFLDFLVEKNPIEMDKVLMEAYRASSEATKAFRAAKQNDLRQAKRAARSEDDPKSYKKAKVGDAGKAASRGVLCADSSGRASSHRRTPHCPTSPPPPYSDNIWDDESDDGVELAKGQENAQVAKQREQAAQEGQEEEQPQTDLDGEQVQKEPGRNKNPCPESAQVQDRTLQVRNPLSQELTISRSELRYEIELGVTRGDQLVLSKLKDSSKRLDKPSAARVFTLCTKLDFYRIRNALIQFHRDRRAEIDHPQKMDRVPSTCDLRKPDEIYDALQVTHGGTKIGKIFRAYGQMRLTKYIKEEARKIEVVNAVQRADLLLLEKRARGKAGNVSESERNRKITSYKEEYHGGQKWQEVSNWFGGRAVVMVFVVAGIGSQTIAKTLNEEQRQALEQISKYLPSIKKLVRALGPGSLEEYCRHGYLSEAKIKELEELEACLPEEADGNGVSDDTGNDTESETCSNARAGGLQILHEELHG